MNTARYHDVQRLFEAALNRPDAEREPFLREQTDDEALRREVLALVASVERDGPPADVMTGARVGPYRVVRELGRGGMGAVYLAERADGQFEQAVALKLVKRGMDSDAVLRRFQQERQILARLQHPAIARLLGGGVADDGRPYFAMEPVDGEPITAYCDRRGLGVDARLALFEQVCDAVAYAHRNLVVHRDLKPSNILVTADGGTDGGPAVRLLDFGIARLLDDDAGLTAADARPMTLAYAAPEQVRGEPVTTATDVYALGVLLYELLAGRRPYDAEGTGGFEAQRAIVEEDPARPSTAVVRAATAGSTTRTAPSGTAETHGLEPRRLRRRLAGDLDTIVLKALRKAPDARYSSAEALGADVGRHRAGLPVLARPATTGYRLRAFVRRHRSGVLVSAAAALLLAGTVAFYTARLTAERDRAQREAARAQQTSAFLRSLFDGADPRTARGQTLTARDLLDQGRDRVDAELGGRPLLQAEMLGMIGEVYHGLGLYPAADSALGRALTLQEQAGAPALAVARTQSALADVRLSRGDHAAADALLQLALARQRAAHAGPHAETATTLRRLGDLLQEQGEYAASEAPYREALEMQRAALPDAGEAAEEAVAGLLAKLGVVLFDLARYDEADRYSTQALAMQRALYGDLHPEVTGSLRARATLLRRLGRYDEAEPLIREAVRLDSVLVGTEHPDFGEDLYELASLLKDQARFADAAAVFERGLDVDLATLGPDHPYVALTLSEIGQTRLRMRDVPGALAYYRRALDLQRRVLPDGHPEIATTLVKMSDAHIAQGDFGRAVSLLREAVGIRAAHLGLAHPVVLKEENRLAMALVRAGRLDEGLAAYERANARADTLLAPDDAEWANSRMGMVSALRLQGSDRARRLALEYAEREAEQNRRRFPAPSRLLGIALLERADLLRLSGDAAGAQPLFREAHDNLARALRPDHPLARRAAQHLDGAAQVDEVPAR